MKMASPGGAFGVRRPGRFEVPDLPWDDVGHRQGLRDRFDEAVGEDEQTLRSLMEQGAAMEGSRVPGGFGVVSPSRVSPGSFTQDPGMRARDEFTDITSRGYNEQAKRVAERGGAKEYATSVEQEAAEGRNDRLRNEIGLALAMLATGGMIGGAGAGWGAARTAGAGVPTALGAAARGAVGRAPVMYRDGRPADPPGMAAARHGSRQEGYSAGSFPPARDALLREELLNVQQLKVANELRTWPSALQKIGPPPPGVDSWAWIKRYARTNPREAEALIRDARWGAFKKYGDEDMLYNEQFGYRPSLPDWLGGYRG